MLRRLRTWMVERAIPGGTADPGHSPFAVVVAVNAIRETVRLALLLGLLILALAAALAYWYVSVYRDAALAAQKRALQAERDSSTTVRELQAQLDGLKRERDALEETLVGVEAYMPASWKKASAAPSPPPRSADVRRKPAKRSGIAAAPQSGKVPTPAKHRVAPKAAAPAQRTQVR